MLEEILLFHSTYSKQLLLDATLIGSTDPIQLCRDGKSHPCSFQDTHHWQSNPSEYREYPCPPAHPTGRVLGWDWCFSWDRGGSLWEVPVQEGIHSCQNDPQISKENPLEDRGVQRQLIPPWALGSRRWRCHQSWGSHAAGEEGTPWHSCSCQQCQPGQEGGRYLSFHHTPPTPDGSGKTWSQAKQSTALGCAVELLPPTPYCHPAQGKGGAAVPLHLPYTPNIPKE